MNLDGWSFADMVEISLDGVEACWLDDGDKRALRGRIRREADRLGGAPA